MGFLGIPSVLSVYSVVNRILRGSDRGWTFGIDAAVVSAELVAATDPADKMYNGAPILAAEILSPNDTHDDIVETVRTYHEVGTVVWIIDPDFETVAVHRPGAQVETRNAQQELDGDPYLPGFRVPVARFFERD